MAERLYVSGLGWRVVAAPFLLFNNLILNVMYKITFFDVQKNKIATHFISADNAMPTIGYVYDYCKMIEKHYPSVKTWRIYEYRCYSMLEDGIDRDNAVMA